MGSDPFLEAAIAEARLGLAEGGIPIGSVLVCDGVIIGRGHNRRVQQGSAILHGEMDAIENAGRHPAGVYRDADGRRFYVKTVESPAHARNETLAAKLYRLAGAPTLTYVTTKAPDQVATVFVELQTAHVARLSEAERKQAQRWLGVHAWTANWDAAGFHGDNQGVIDGVVTTLDLGGALEFRAHGDAKGKAFGDRVSEIDTLRTDPDNPHAMRLFAGMTSAEVGEAVAVVLAIPDDAIAKVVAAHGAAPALAEKLIARKADMANRRAYTQSRG